MLQVYRLVLAWMLGSILVIIGALFCDAWMTAFYTFVYSFSASSVALLVVVFVQLLLGRFG